MGSLSPLLIASAALVCLGEILHIVGLATDFWLDADKGDANAGLWEICGNSVCLDLDKATVFWDDKSASVEAVRAMAILGMLCGLVGAVSAVLVLVFVLLDKAISNIIPLAGMISTVVAFVLIIIGIIIFAADVNDEKYLKGFDYGYSFALCIVGGILMAVGGVLLQVGSKSMAS